MSHKRIAIVGGGIGGLTLAIALQKIDLDVTVYEHAPVLKPLGAGIVLAGNAMKAFMAIDMDQAVIKAGKPMKRFVVKDHKGNALRVTEAAEIDWEYGVVNTLTLHRADLHRVLYDRLRAGTVILDKACVDFKQISNSVELLFSDGTTAIADYVIAADGVHSVFRRKLVPASIIRYAGYTCWRAVTDQLPDDFDYETASESWGAGKRFGIVPLTNNRAYWFATTSAPYKDTTMAAFTIDDLKVYYAAFHPPVGDLLSGTKTEQLLHHDIIDIKPIRQFAFGRIALLGDAAHATTPNLGQGACMAIEDAVVLGNCLSSSVNIEDAFRDYERRRLTRTSKIMNASYQLGKIAQIQNPLLVMLRNAMMKGMPESFSRRQEKFLYEISFS